MGNEARLTDEERQMLALISEGHQMSVVARKLFVSERTLRRWVRNVCDKLGVESPVSAVAMAARHGLI